MTVALITGAAGLIGSETARFCHEQGMEVVGIDNDMRSYFFGQEASTRWNAERLDRTLTRYSHHDLDVRDQAGLDKLFRRFGRDISMVVHAAAQPSHDWAAKEPATDFSINANGTLVLLELTRKVCPGASFIFTSTNKVYGDLPNQLPLVEQETRWELDPSHPYAEYGIDESMSIDQSKHSLFGASKVAGDILVQEYGRYFGMRTASFRGGCLTGPAHSGAELHGFLAYLVKCIASGKPYRIFGYKGKQVRDNIHAFDFVNAFWHFHLNPKSAAVYNLGGSRHSNCSILEAISLIEQYTGRESRSTLSEQARAGDHMWWISDVRRFQQDYPQWRYQYGLRDLIREIVEAVQDRADGLAR